MMERVMVIDQFGIGQIDLGEQFQRPLAARGQGADATPVLAAKNRETTPKLRPGSTPARARNRPHRA